MQACALFTKTRNEYTLDMSLERELKNLDAERLLIITEKVLGQLHMGEISESPEIPIEDYPSLGALILRAYQMSEVLEEKTQKEGIEIDSESRSFIRGLGVGMWVGVAILKEYAETENFEFEARFNDSSETT